MRSRNTEFFAFALKPKTRYYQFLDGRGDVDVVPKLIEIKNSDGQDGSDGVFQVGETVVGSVGTDNLIRFRVELQIIKEVYITTHPKHIHLILMKLFLQVVHLFLYPQAYSQTFTVLNVDTKSLVRRSCRILLWVYNT